MVKWSKNIFPCRLIGKSLGFGPKEFLFESRHGNQKYFVCSDMRKRELLGDSENILYVVIWKIIGKRFCMF